MSSKSHPLAYYLSVYLDIYRLSFECVISGVNKQSRGVPGGSDLSSASHDSLCSEQLTYPAKHPGICYQIHSRLAEVFINCVAIDDLILLQSYILIEEQS